MNQSRKQDSKSALSNAIAIIGMAGRFPGARDLDTFRQNLENGVESITVLSDDDLIRAGVDRNLLTNPNYVKAAPLLEDADRFDAGFFDYSPREATIMDPQQRLFLECSWEALEDAGHAGDAAGTATGVFSGGGGIMSTYLLSDTHFNPRLTGTTASMEHVGNDKDYLSTRVSYKLDLRGPSLTVQTACSTSLVAVHLACQSLIHGECDMALAGGTTVRVPHVVGHLYKEGNVFSRDGHCRAFDADAEGTVFGSGVGVVVLKRLQDAIRDHDAIHAVIRGTAINNDGSNKISYWAPHDEGQAEAMRRALAAAGVDPATIRYVEAHGTATKRGDPTEVRALAKAFGAAPGARCGIGSVKSNIGHPESAAGVAGLIKAVLSLEHQVLFPSLHYSRPNPEMDPNGAFYVVDARTPWVAESFPRRAAVNALGIGGTNAFAVLEEAPQPPVPSTVRADRPWHVLPLSAKSPDALEALAQRFGTYLENGPAASLADICFTAGVGRAHFDHRLAVVAPSVEVARTTLAGTASSALVRGHVRHGERPRVVFLFTGQGSQYAGMARELYETHAEFRDVFDQCAEGVSSYLERPLRDVVYGAPGETTPIDETAYTQPALFALEYALAAVWRSWGIEPSVVIGHSVGEVAAACVAGVFSLEDGLRLIAERGRLMQALPRGGGMAALGCEAAQLIDRIAPYRDEVSLAAINGPTEVVLSGRMERVEAIVAEFEREGISATRLQVSHAFHSPLMEPMLAEFGRVAGSISYSLPRTQFVSNVTGALATAEIATPEYWVRHVTQPVRFAEGIVAALALADVPLEIGPKPVLLGMARQCVPEGAGAWLASLRAGRSDWQQMAESVAGLYVCGAPLNWAAFDQGHSRHRVHLPTYPFQRQRYWMDAAPAGLGSSQASLLGRRMRLPGSTEYRFETQWSADGPRYLTDHRLFGTVVVPGASHMAMVLAGVKETSRQQSCVLADVVFPQALALPNDAARTAQLVISDPGGDEASFQVLSLRDGQDETQSNAWSVHATGRIEPAESVSPASAPLADWQARCTRLASGRDFYETFWEAGYHLGPAFQWISRTWSGEGELLCELTWPELPDDPARYPLYPSLIDACFQCVFGDKARAVLSQDAVYVPFSVQRFTFARTPPIGKRLWCHIRMSPDGAETARRVDADITVCDDAGFVMARFEGCQLREVRRDALRPESHTDLSDALYEVEWRPEPLVPAAATGTTRDAGVWVVFADAGSSLADGLIERLHASDQRGVRVEAGPYRLVGPDRYQVDGTSPNDLRRLLDDLSGSGQPLRGLIHLWSLDVTPMGDPTSLVLRDRAGSSLLHLVQALAQRDVADAPRLWIVTRGAQPVEPWPANLAVEQAPVWGLGQVLALEHPDMACVRVDLDPFGRPSEVQQLFEDVWTPDRHDQVAYRRGLRHVPRLVRWSPRTVGDRQEGPLGGRPVQVRLSAYGQLDNLALRPMTRRGPGPGEVEIQVRAAGLNFRDVLNALGLLEAHYARHLGVASATQMTFGFECSGTVVALGTGVSGVAVGQDVIAVATHDALGSFVTVRQEFVAPKPGHVTFEEAATLPLAFLTAYHGLHTLAALKPGERVLIHAAAGGVGLAAVHWAQQAGAEVFATASPGKWGYLRGIGVKHVMSSRSTDFASEVMTLTGGRGVDVVLNSLSGEFVDRSFDVLGTGGRFVELGKRDVWSAEDARTRRPDVSYFPFDLMEVSRQDASAIEGLLAIMSDRWRAGTLSPLPHIVFPVTRVTDAFRFMAEARHIGKIVVAFPAAPARRDAEPVSVRTDGCYMVTGGLGALGLEIAKWLAEQGARHLILVGRRPPAGDALAALERLAQSGARVLTVEADVAEARHVDRLRAAILDTGQPLRGLVHAAGLLDDGVLLQQTWDRFRHVMAPKVEGTWNLHVMTRDLPLDFFVAFSSVASLLGNAGQANYAAGNAFVDAMAHYRRAHANAALSINWGPWGEVGMAAVVAGARQRRLAEQGFRPIVPEQGIDVFARLLRTGATQVGVVPVNWSEYLKRKAAASPFFDRVGALSAPPVQVEADIRNQLRRAADPRAVLLDYVRSVIGAVLGMRDPNEIDPRARLFDMGLESLMAVELRGRFQQSLGCPLRSTLLFDYPTVESLVDHLVTKVSSVEPTPDAPPVDPRQALADEIGDLGEDELAAQLAQELWTSAKPREP